MLWSVVVNVDMALDYAVWNLISCMVFVNVAALAVHGTVDRVQVGARSCSHC